MRLHGAYRIKLEPYMSEEQKDRIIEAVQMAKDGFITRNEMAAKIKDIAEINQYEETIG
jgi:hypothetical protein